MDAGLKKTFIIAIMRLKKSDICATSGNMQISELIVMGKAMENCDCPEKDRNVSEIQQAVYLSKPAISQTLNNLEKKGFITRAIDQNDRRKITVELTDAGRQALGDAMQCFNRELDSILGEFGTENTCKLVELSTQLMDIMDKYNAK